MNVLKSKKSSIVRNSLMGLILCAILCIDIKSEMTIHIATDEFGYWTGAANFLKWDWSNCASLNSYYSFGYSIFLLPILAVVKNPVLSYKTAILLNIIFIELSFFKLFKIFRKIFNETNEQFVLFSSFIVMCYSANIINVKLTLSECCLTFCFISVVEKLLSYLSKRKIQDLILLFLYGCMAFCIHMRAIVILIALVFCITIFTYYDVKFKKIITGTTIFLIIALTIIIEENIKSNLINMQYLNNQLVSFNDISGQVNKLSFLLSKEGILAFIAGFAGRIYYLGYATLLLIYFGVYSCIKELIKSFKKKQHEIFCLHMFFLLSLLFAISVSDIFMINLRQARTDALFYGRYSEYVIVPIIMIGIKEFWTNKKKVKLTFAFSIIQLVLSLAVSRFVVFYQMNGMLDISIPALYYWVKFNNYDVCAYISSGIFVASISFCLCIIGYKKNNKINYFFIAMCFALYWIFLGHNSYQISDLHKYDEEYIETYQAVCNNIGDNTLVYYCFDEEEKENAYRFQGICRIQFCLRNNIIQFCDAYNYNSIPPNSLIIIQSKSTCLDYYKSSLQELMHNNEFIVYKN